MTQEPPTARRQATSFGQIAGRPAELVIAAALLVGSAVYVVIASALKLGDIFDVFDFNTRTGLWALVVMLVVVLAGVLQALAGWLIFDADPLGRALAVIVALGWTLAMIAAETRGIVPFEKDAAPAYVVAMICALVAAAIVLIGPEGARAFASNDGRRASTSMTAARMTLLMAGAALVVIGVTQLIAVLGGDGDGRGKNIACAIVMIIAGGAGAAASRILTTPAMEIRLGISLVGLAAFILVLALGPRTFGSVMAASLLAVAPILLWVARDARAFFGEAPLSTPGPTPGSAARTTGAATTRAMPVQRPVAHAAPAAHGAATTTTCASCGASLDEGDAFCGSCGTRVPEPEPEPEPEPAVADAPRTCPSCGREAAEDARFCPGCGTGLPERQRTCGGCGAALAADDRFCAFCGRAAGT